MTETATAARRYAEEQVKPLIARLQKHESAFLPQTVPTYSAIQLFQYLHKANPQYTYKDAMLDPTNPADRATDWESDLIAKFRSDPSLQSIHQERNSAIGKSVFFASPIIIANTACLECHSSPTHAPVAMIREYGPSNGFGWKLNEIVGVQIVSVPASLPTTMAHQALVKLFIYGALIAIASVLLLDWLLLITVIRPVAKLDHMADQISQGKLTEEIPARGRDEISTLALSFNRMQRSLARAIKLLEKDEPGT
jgi:HAMP domain-containing protein